MTDTTTQETSLVKQIDKINQTPLPQQPARPAILGMNEPFLVTPCNNGSFQIVIYHADGRQEPAGESSVDAFCKWFADRHSTGSRPIGEEPVDDGSRVVNFFQRRSA